MKSNVTIRKVLVLVFISSFTRCMLFELRQAGESSITQTSLYVYTYLRKICQIRYHWISIFPRRPFRNRCSSNFHQGLIYLLIRDHSLFMGGAGWVINYKGTQFFKKTPPSPFLRYNYSMTFLAPLDSLKIISILPFQTIKKFRALILSLIPPLP